MNRQPFPSFSVGPQRPARMATYHRNDAPTARLSFMAGVVFGAWGTALIVTILEAVL